MKKYMFLLIVIAFTGIIFWSCSEDGGGTTPDPDENTLTCNITSPLVYTGFFAGDSISVVANADDTDGTIIQVRFILDDNGFSADDEFPYTAKIPTDTLIVGSHTVTAIAENDKGKEVTSSLVVGIKPKSPTNLTITQLNVYSFSLAWNDNSTGEDGFKVERKIDDGDYIEIAQTTEKTYTDSTVMKKEFSQVYYQVRAYKEIYNSNYTENHVTVGFPAPTSFTYTKENLSTIRLNWKDNSNGEDGFKIDKKVGADNWVIDFATVGENIKTWSDTSAEINEILQYRIYGYKGLNTSDLTQTLTIDNTFTPPLNLIFTRTDSVTVKLDWTDTSIGESGFIIDKKIGDSDWIVEFDTVEENTSSWSETNLIVTEKYQYKVRAFFQTYYTEDSNIISFSFTYENMVFVEGGLFVMGDQYIEGNSVELPVHNVQLSNFYLSIYELTQSEWAVYMPPDTYNYGIGEDNPVYSLSWFEAIKYCNLRSMAEELTPCYTISSSTDPADWGDVPTLPNDTWNAVTCDFSANGYRLPTEAEWEYAARGGIHFSDNYRYSGCHEGTDLMNYAWFDSDGTSYTNHPVGTKMPNQLGIYDMSGNQWEWCWDWYGSTYYQTCFNQGTVTDPKGPTAASTGTSRVLRGGDAYNEAVYCRVASRYYYGSFGSNAAYGFRIARTK